MCEHLHLTSYSFSLWSSSTWTLDAWCNREHSSVPATRSLHFTKSTESTCLVSLKNHFSEMVENKRQEQEREHTASSPPCTDSRHALERVRQRTRGSRKKRRQFQEGHSGFTVTWCLGAQTLKVCGRSKCLQNISEQTSDKSKTTWYISAIKKQYLNLKPIRPFTTYDSISALFWLVSQVNNCLWEIWPPNPTSIWALGPAWQMFLPCSFPPPQLPLLQQLIQMFYTIPCLTATATVTSASFSF